MAGTIMEKTRTPLTTWFEAAWYLTTAKNGFLAKLWFHAVNQAINS